MKGLLVKDLYLLLNQKLFLAGILLICLVYGLSDHIENGLLIAFVWGVGITAVISSSTISWDEQNHSLPFLFTLPFSRKTYVREKFLLSWILPGSFFLLLSICGILRGKLSLELFGLEFSVLLLIVTCVSCVEIPLLLALGPEKSRIFLVIIMFVTVGGLYEFLGNISLSSIPAGFLSLSVPVLILIVFSVCAVLTVVSMKGAVRILKSKNF